MGIEKMKKYSKYIIPAIVFVLLTLTTQIGGLIFLVCIPVFNLINRHVGEKIGRILLKTSAFFILYITSTFYIVPPLAISLGRVPMPYGETNPNLKPLNFSTVLLNRHYVTPQLKGVTEGVVAKMVNKYSDTCMVQYLECNFPFINGFRLLPHLTHEDGQKIDLSFQYLDAKSKKPTTDRPSWLGYGVCEEPRAGEENQPGMCDEKGEWQYNFLKKYLIPQGSKSDFILDAAQTHDLVRFFVADSHVNIVLIEPHLKKRLGFEQVVKVRRPPCNAVRHDDHIHVSIY